MTPNELEQTGIVARAVIQDSDFTQRERAILLQIVKWSYERGREWAVFKSQAQLGVLTGIHSPDVTNSLRNLRDEGVLLQKKDATAIYFRFLPHGVLAPAPLKVDAAAASAIGAELELLNSLPTGFEPGGQKKLPLPASPEEQVITELADNSCATAVEAAQVSKSLTDQQPAISKTLTQLVSETLRRGESSVPARAEHDHVLPLPTAKHAHDHAHANELLEKRELTPAENDLILQIEELCECEGRNAHFRTTWELRVKDKPIQSFQALGETRRMKTEGKIRKTIGGTLNFNFKLFCEAARSASKKASLFFM